MSEENQVVENLVVEPTPVVEPELVVEPAPVIEPAPIIEPTPVFESEPVVESAPIVIEVAQPMPEENLITAPSHPVTEVATLGLVEDGIIGSTVTKIQNSPKKSFKKDAPKQETVALFSTKNVTWSEVGKVYRGYNIVTKSAADKWLTRNHIRLATPEEIAREFGN